MSVAHFNLTGVAGEGGTAGAHSPKRGKTNDK